MNFHAPSILDQLTVLRLSFLTQGCIINYCIRRRLTIVVLRNLSNVPNRVARQVTRTGRPLDNCRRLTSLTTLSTRSRR